MHRLLVVLAAAILGGFMPAWAFDVHTHAAMTAEAVRQSTFTQTPGLSQQNAKLGLVDPAILGGPQYFDLGATAFMLSRNTTEEVFARLRLQTTGLTIPDTYSLSGWLVQGAIREDDNPVETPNSDDPAGVFRRVFGHFFDPQNNRGLTFGNIRLGDRAVDWALLPTATADIPVRQNHFKIGDAREAMWRALTLTARDTSGGYTGSPWPSNWPTATAESVRRAYWATTFRVLGNVVHLIQDMAQPQHSRNDRHSGLGCVGQVCLAGHSSFFEQYLRARTRQDPSFSLDEGPLTDTADPRRVEADQLVYAGYPKPTFNAYADYFSTGLDVASRTGYGLANYSNRGFYSSGTNINSSAAVNDYPSPHPRGLDLSQEVLTGGAFQDMTKRVMPQGSLTLVTGTVRDYVVPSQDASNVRLSAVGMWDQFLQPRTGRRSHTLNYYNYDDQARLLVPRAVAYSAGLIDYFFRGQMEISLPDSGVYAIVDHAAFAGLGAPATDAAFGYKGFSRVRLMLKNTTPDIHAPDGGTYVQNMGAGHLVAVAKFRRNLNYKDNLSGEKGGATPEEPEKYRSATEEIVVSGFLPVSSVPSGAATLYEFIFSQEIPINATDLYLQVVFRGALGQEADAVVVATRDISEPTYFALMNSTDYKLTPDGHTYHCTAETNCSGGAMGAAVAFYRDGITGQLGASVATHGLAVGSFIRFAFLTDPQPEAQFVYSFAVQNRWPPDAWSYSPARNQLNQVPTLVTRQRQVYNTNYKAILNDPDGQPTAVRTLDPDELDQALQYPHPQPIECLTALLPGCVDPS